LKQNRSRRASAERTRATLVDVFGTLPIFLEIQVKARSPAILVASLFVYFGGVSQAQAAVDAEAAQELARENDCFKCHAIEKTKKGPSYKKIAEKYKGKADGEEKCIKNITTGPKVKLEDGTEEKHRIIDTQDTKAMKNLCGWILSR
jgi:cytochrome c